MRSRGRRKRTREEDEGVNKEGSMQRLINRLVTEIRLGLIEQQRRLLSDLVSDRRRTRSML